MNTFKDLAKHSQVTPAYLLKNLHDFFDQKVGMRIYASKKDDHNPTERLKIAFHTKKVKRPLRYLSVIQTTDYELIITGIPYNKCRVYSTKELETQKEYLEEDEYASFAIDFSPETRFGDESMVLTMIVNLTDISWFSNEKFTGFMHNAMVSGMAGTIDIGGLDR